MFKFFVIGIMVLVIILAFLFLPKASITLGLASQPFTHDMEIRLDGKLEKILPQLNAIPARLLEMPEGTEMVVPDGFVTMEGLQDAKQEEILVFREVDILTLVNIKIKPILEELGKLEKIGESQISWQVEDLNLAEKYAKLKVHLEKTVFPKLELEEIKEVLAGKSEEGIEKYLEKLPGVREIEIKFWPSWLKRAPRMKERIRIEY